MSIREQLQRRYTSFLKGVDNSTDINSKDIEGTLSEAANCDLVDESLVVKRKGYESRTANWNDLIIRQGLEFTYGTTKKVMLYGEKATTTGTTGQLGFQNGAGTPTDVQTGLSDADRPTMIQFRDLFFFFNGVNEQLYDGTQIRQIGIGPSGTNATLASNIAGSLNTSSDYLYAYTYYNSTTGAESSPSPISIPLDSSGSGGIRINILAGPSSIADTIRIYRSTAFGATLFLEGTTNISSTTFDSTIDDSALGNELELDNSELTETPRYAIQEDNRLFVAGFNSNPNRVQYSKIGINGPMPESFQALDFTDCNLNDGDKIIGLNVVNGTVIVLKERSIGKLVRIDALEQIVELGGSAKYIYQELANDITGVSHHTMTVLDNLLIWLGTDDIYATDGQTITRAGRRIFNTITEINFNQKAKFSATTKFDTQQILFSVALGTSIEPNFQIVGHFKNKIPAWTFYQPGTNPTTHPGLRAASLFSVTTNSELTYYFGNSNGDGLIYQYDTGTNDNGNGIYWRVYTPWESFRNMAAKKMYHSAYTHLLGNGKSYSVRQTFQAEQNNIVVREITTDIQQDDIILWATQNWAAFNWGSLQYQFVKFHPHYRAYLGRFGFENFNADEPVAMRGLTVIAQRANIR